MHAHTRMHMCTHKHTRTSTDPDTHPHTHTQSNEKLIWLHLDIINNSLCIRIHILRNTARMLSFQIKEIMGGKCVKSKGIRYLFSHTHTHTHTHTQTSSNSKGSNLTLQCVAYLCNVQHTTQSNVQRCFKVLSPKAQCSSIFYATECLFISN